MKIYIWTIGKAHEPHLKEGIELFTQRISHYYPVEWKYFPNAKNASSKNEEQIKKAESVAILSSLSENDFLVALDERGKHWSSPELADFILKKTISGTKNLIFLIGGAYGIDEGILKICKVKWSLSRLVFPHQLVRLILVEQIYRACTIIRNEKYHHS